MTPPKDYFDQVPEGTPGAQRVGVYFFAFKFDHLLSDMIDDEMFERPSADVLEDLSAANDRINELEEELEELKAKLAE